MKKLLLVLLVVALASFLFVGCLPGVTPGEGEDEGEGEVEPTIDIVVEDQYFDGTKTYVRAATLKVTVTFSEAVEEEYVVSVTADGAGTDQTETLSPDASRKVWTGDLDFTGVAESDCEDICLIVEVKHPCCPGEDVIYKIVTIDSGDPCASFIVSIEDCGECEEGASMSWVTTCEDECDVPKDCCGDYCSGVGDWSFVLNDDPCDGPCDTATGNGCSINSAFECGCLLYATATEGTKDHVVKVSIKDNVGHEITDTWTLTFDTDEPKKFVSANLGELLVTTTSNGWQVKVDNNCDWDDCDVCFPTD